VRAAPLAAPARGGPRPRPARLALQRPAAGHRHRLLRLAGAGRRRAAAAAAGTALHLRAQADGRPGAGLRGSAARGDDGRAVGRAPRARDAARAGGPGALARYPLRMPDTAFLRELPPVASFALLLLAAWLSGVLVRSVLLRMVARMAEASPMHWDDAIVRSGTLSRLAQVVPALVVLAGMGLVEGLPAWLHLVVRNVAVAWIAIAL